MSNRKTTLFYAVLIAIASLSVGMVIASRLGLSPESSAQTVAAPAMNSAPLTGAVDAATFRNIAKAVSPAVVNIRTESKQRAQDLSDFFGAVHTRAIEEAVMEINAEIERAIAMENAASRAKLLERCHDPEKVAAAVASRFGDAFTETVRAEDNKIVAADPRPASIWSDVNCRKTVRMRSRAGLPVRVATR